MFDQRSILHMMVGKYILRKMVLVVVSLESSFSFVPICLSCLLFFNVFFEKYFESLTILTYRRSTTYAFLILKSLFSLLILSDKIENFSSFCYSIRKGNF